MFHKTEDLKGNFLEQTKNAREERALEKRREEAAVIIQAKIRSWLARIRYTQGILQDFDSLVPDLPENYTKEDFKQALDIYQQGLRLLSIWNEERDKDRFAKFCRYLVASLDFDSPKISYVGVALNKEYVISWISHMNNVLWKCCEYLQKLKPELSSDMKLIILFLHTLVCFTSTNTWMVLKNKNMEILKPGMNQLCANLMGQLFHRGFYLVLKEKIRNILIFSTSTSLSDFSTGLTLDEILRKLCQSS